jgi:hypothetical protein
MLGLRTTSNAVVPTSNRQVIEETPVVEEPQKAPIEGCLQQSPSILLKKILDDYKTLFVDKIVPNEFTVYDLLVLIENIANNLNKFFEDFLHFYPIIIFKVDEKGNKTYYDDDMKFLKIQDRFVKINSIIRYYIEKLGNMYYNKPRFARTRFIGYSLLKEHYTTERNYGTYLDTSKIVYNGILDGTQKGIKEYKRAMLNFFKFKYILKLKDYDMKSKFGNNYNEYYEFFDINIDVDYQTEKDRLERFKKNEMLDIYIDVPVDFNGTVEYERLVRCKICDGTGKDMSSKIVIRDIDGNIVKVFDGEDGCDFCEGSGKYMDYDCTFCDGKGKVGLNPCGVCKGEKRILGKQKLSKIKLTGEVTKVEAMGNTSKLEVGKVGHLIIRNKVR